MSQRFRSAIAVFVLATLSGAAVAQITAPAEVPLEPPPPPAGFNLPDMGSSANAMVSRADEYQVGRVMVNNLRQEGALLEDPEINEYLVNVGQRLGSAAQEGIQRFDFFLVRDPSWNAFALPGGFIGVNSGLLQTMDTESELAAVVAHEVGHVTQRHIARAVQAQSRQSISTMAAMLGAILIGALAGGGDAAPGLITLAQGAAMQQQINFTRMEEVEADSVGIGYMSAAGFDPNAVAAVWSGQMRRDGLDLSEIPDLLKTHPVDRARIAAARSRAAQLPKQHVADSPTFELVRERVRVIAAKSDADMRKYYEGQMAKGDHGLAVRYGLSLAQMRHGEPEKAAKTLARLVDDQPGLTMLHAALGQALMAANHKPEALAAFDKAVTLYPRNVPLSVRYAEALIEAGDAGKAHQLLLDLFNNTVATPEQIRLIALAASAAGDTGDAYFYMSEYHIVSGNLMLATQQLDLALAAPRLTEVQRKRFLARRDEIRNFLRDQRRTRGGDPVG